ncbi:hypothetical protein AB834_01010 [PVC group bacterium (ex Bugula neritina AB1)]|nr:hypothetical protein AB834_01010 [PVC group bacterium (ex Bugula neritina AB1)]
MFGVTLSTIIVIYIAVPLLVIFLLWLFCEMEQKDLPTVLKDQELMIACPYCLHVFLENNDEDILSCPACSSFVDRRKDVPVKNDKKTV